MSTRHDHNGDSLENSQKTIAQALGIDFQREHELVNLIIRGCIEYRWAVGDEERAIAQAMIFNAYENYLVERGMSIAEAGNFCEQQLDHLIEVVLAEL